MIPMGTIVRAKTGAAILACGAAAVIALTGCSSGGSGSSGTSGSGSGGSGSGSGSGASAGASSAPASPPAPAAPAAPAWAAALGPGVTITPPETTAPGTTSPGAVLTAFAEGVSARNVQEICGVIANQAACLSDLRKMTQSQLGQLGTIKNFKLGYVAVMKTSAGNAEALVGNTGSNCVPGEKPGCVTNNDPAAIFDGNAKPFAALWKAQVAATNSPANAYSLNPCVEIGGKWYADLELS